MHLVIFGVYMVYICISLFGTVLTQLSEFIKMILHGIEPYFALHEVLFPQDDVFLAICAVSIFCGGILFDALLIASLCESSRIRCNNIKLLSQEKHIVRVLFIEFILACLGFYTYMGWIGLFHRGKEYLFIISSLSLSLLISSIKKTRWMRKALIVFIIAAILTSSYVHFNSGANRENLSFSENLEENGYCDMYSPKRWYLRI